MDRNTDLRNMDAPAVGSGKEANEGPLKAASARQTESETGSNVLDEYVTPKQPTSGASGRAKH